MKEENKKSSLFLGKKKQKQREKEKEKKISAKPQSSQPFNSVRGTRDLLSFNFSEN